ncbi:MAG TPA: hypothetical protein DDY24_05020, partial [Alcaligenaceae bacterium]|nr:hypothetical protein [Alcaligenaceae bacterium]
MFSSVRKVADSGGNVLLRSFFSVFGVASVLLSGLLLVSPSRAQGNAGKPPALPVSVIEVSPVTLPNILEVTAQAEGAKETEVRS